MATELFANNAASTLNGSITSLATSLTVVDASTFPTSGNFRIRVDDELMLVTAVSSTTFTISRGIESSVTASHSSGAKVTHVLTAAALANIGSGVGYGLFSARPAASKNGNVYIPTDGFELDVDNGSIWTPYGPLFTITPLVISNFSWVNQGGATLTEYGSAYSILAPSNSGDSIRMQVKSVLTAPYTATIMFESMPIPANYFSSGLILRDSSSGKLVTYGYGYNASSIIASSKYNSPTSWSADYSSITIANIGKPPRFIRITDNNTNRILSYSHDGINFQTFYSVSRTDWITPNQIGFFIDGNNATYSSAITVYSWLETQP